MDEAEVLWGLYREHCDQGRHHETMRATVTNVFLTITAGVTGVIGLDQRISTSDLPLSLFIMFLGVFGAFMVAKHYERVQLHTERARAYRDELEAQLPATKINDLKNAADKKHRVAWPRLYSLRLFWLWIGVQCGIVAFGLILSVVAICSPAQQQNEETKAVQIKGSA